MPSNTLHTLCPNSTCRCSAANLPAYADVCLLLKQLSRQLLSDIKPDSQTAQMHILTHETGRLSSTHFLLGTRVKKCMPQHENGTRMQDVSLQLLLRHPQVKGSVSRKSIFFEHLETSAKKWCGQQKIKETPQRLFFFLNAHYHDYSLIWQHTWESLQFSWLLNVFFRIQDGGFLTSFVESGHMHCHYLSVHVAWNKISAAGKRCAVSIIFCCPCLFLCVLFCDVQEPLPTKPVVYSSKVNL